MSCARARADRPEPARHAPIAPACALRPCPASDRAAARPSWADRVAMGLAPLVCLAAVLVASPLAPER